MPSRLPSQLENSPFPVGSNSLRPATRHATIQTSVQDKHSFPTAPPPKSIASTNVFSNRN